MATEIENTNAAQVHIAQALEARAAGDVIGAASHEAQAAALAPWLFQKKSDSGIPTWAWIAAAIGAGWFFLKGK